MIIDLVMGVTALMIGLWLGACSGPLADQLREGDERYRENHPWVETFEPQVGFLQTADGRRWILRSWLLMTAVGFLGVGVALAVRGALVAL